MSFLGEIFGLEISIKGSELVWVGTHMRWINNKPMELCLDPFYLGKRGGHLALAVMNRFKHHTIYDI